MISNSILNAETQRHIGAEIRSIQIISIFLFHFYKNIWNNCHFLLNFVFLCVSASLRLCVKNRVTNLISLLPLFFSYFSSTLLADEVKVPAGLPPISWPTDNPYSPEKVELGRLLYFDPRLSTNGTISCASCHAPREAFSDRRPLSIGIGGEKGRRHSMTIINSAYLTNLFWDGRAKTLEDQSLGPIGDRKEMSYFDSPHEAYWDCQERVQKIMGYKPLFKKVFGTYDVTIEDISKAIATYERTILSGNSRYDRYVKGDKQALNAEEIHGYQLFGQKNCLACHHGVNFANGKFANIGVGMNVPNPDLGRYEITKNKKDWGAFKVPMLREVANTSPYMHDGSLKTLEEVIDYYDKGGNPNANLHPLMVPLHLTEQDKKDLVSFLKSLSGEGWQNNKPPKEFPQ